MAQLAFDGMSREEVSIARIQHFEPKEGYYLAFSGGKDSTVLYDLVVRSGVRFDAHYSMTGIDPPELVRFIRDNYPNVEWHRPEQSIWKWIEKKQLPRRQGRWCCEALKETGGSGRTVLTGIRWAESGRRRARGLYEVCKRDGTKRYLNPIIDWTTEQVWDYIHDNKIPYCSLYDEVGDEVGDEVKDGKPVKLFTRLGCVLCPMTTAAGTQREMKRWPKLAEAWHRATLRLWEARKDRDSFKRWKSGEELWLWWIGRGEEPEVDEAQCFMFDD